ncbi:MAG: LOG family protein [Acidobacteria bacterium]|nr:LOG family protein [Acidobacteriota bacterium]
MSVVTVFGSSRPQPESAEYETARELGAALAGAGFTVCTGGYGGVMEAVSRGAREAGGHTIGVTAEVFRSRANAWVAEEVRVKTWQERLFELVRRGAAYIVLPGGTGTLAELSVVWELLNKGFLAQKPLVVLGDFWQPVLDVIEKKEDASHLILRARHPREAVELLKINLSQ